MAVYWCMHAHADECSFTQISTAHMVGSQTQILCLWVGYTIVPNFNCPYGRIYQCTFIIPFISSHRRRADDGVSLGGRSTLACSTLCLLTWLSYTFAHYLSKQSTTNALILITSFTLIFMRHINPVVQKTYCKHKHLYCILLVHLVTASMKLLECVTLRIRIG